MKTYSRYSKLPAEPIAPRNGTSAGECGRYDAGGLVPAAEVDSEFAGRVAAALTKELVRA